MPKHRAFHLVAELKAHLIYGLVNGKIKGNPTVRFGLGPFDKQQVDSLFLGAHHGWVLLDSIQIPECFFQFREALEEFLKDSSLNICIFIASCWVRRVYSFQSHRRQIMLPVWMILHFPAKEN